MTDMNVSKSTRTMTVTGLMLAMTLILTLTPIGFIQVPPISITIMHLPVIIAGMIAGPISGFIVGLGMGLASMFRAITSVNPADKLFVNPLVSVLPRVFIGVTSYYAYTLVRGALIKLKNKDLLQGGLAATVGALTGTLTNTVLVLGMLWLVHFANETGAIAFFISVLSINVVIEVIVAIIVCVPVAIVIERMARGRY